MSRWIAALLVQATLGELLNSPAATEDGLCSTPTAADTTPAQALLQKGTRISEMSTHSGQATRTETHNLLEESEHEETSGRWEYEPLSEEGYQIVAATCCNYDMEEYTRRLIQDLGLQLCGDAGLDKIVPYFTCEKGIQTFAILRAELLNKVADPCPVAASPGACPPETSECGGVSAAGRRRNCRNGIVNTQTTTTTTTTAETTTTPEISTTLEAVTTTTTTTTTTTEKATTTTPTPTTTTTTTVTTTTTTSTSTGCEGETDLLDFFNSNLAHNNLGGKGPSAGVANMRYEAIGVAKGRSFDLVVVGNDYTSINTADNGYECGMSSAACTTGSYGQIDVAAGTSVDLTLSFQDSETEAAVTLDSFMFSVHDIDQLDSTVKEAVYISGFAGNVTVSPSTAVNVAVQADGRTRLKSTADECIGDDPLNPMFLGPVTCGGETIDTTTRSAAFKFENIASFAMTLEATCSGCAPGSHRKFMFTGNTNLITCGSRQRVY